LVNVATVTPSSVTASCSEGGLFKSPCTVRASVAAEVTVGSTVSVVLRVCTPLVVSVSGPKPMLNARADTAEATTAMRMIKPIVRVRLVDIK
jgi:hypothetical protein